MKSGRASIGRGSGAHNVKGLAKNGGRAAPRSAHRGAASSGMKVPIAIKYAVVTGVLLVLCMIILGRALHSLGVATADREINDKGIKSAVLVATHVDPFWTRELDATAKAEAMANLKEDLSSFLNDPGARGVVDVLILDSSASAILASASGKTAVALLNERLMARPDATGVEVFTGFMKSEGGEVLPARSYRRAIRSDKAIVGYVRVFLSAQAIQEMKDRLSRTVIWYVLIGAVLAIGVVVVVGGILTQPVRVLKRDMDLVAAGNLHHQSNISTGDELQQLAVAFNSMTAHLAEAQQQESERQALERELSIATDIQTALLPDRIPSIPGYQLFPYYSSAKEVGGDYYDFIPLGEDHYAVVVADVSGKGIPGSLVMTMTRSLMRMAARNHCDPKGLLAGVNASLANDMTRGMFVTLVLADIDSKRNTVGIARAGHNPAYIYKSQTGELAAIQPPGIALGMDEGAMFNQVLSVQEVPLEDGDFLVLYTDGIVEAMDPKQREYSNERFAQVLKAYHQRSAREIVEGVIADVEKHTRGAEVSDDITLIVIKKGDVAPPRL